MTVLPDTSVWIEYLRGREPAAAQLDSLLAADSIVLCPPVAAELLAGSRADQASELVLALMGLPVVELDYSAWLEAASAARALRQRGANVPLMDSLIAVAAIRADAELWTRDEDFARIAEVMPALRLSA